MNSVDLYIDLKITEQVRNEKGKNLKLLFRKVENINKNYYFLYSKAIMHFTK